MHQNTAKCSLCTPNGRVSLFFPPLHVGGMLDVELTHISGLLNHLEDMGISIMADRGFTIKDI